MNRLLTSAIGVFFSIICIHSIKAQSTPALVTDLYTQPAQSVGSPRLITNVNGTLYFFADSSYYQGSMQYSSEHLWKSNGTSSGTVKVAQTGYSYYTYGSYVNTSTDALAVGNYLYFINSVTGSYPAGGQSLSRSDGTPGGTIILKTVSFGLIYNLVPIGNTLYFSMASQYQGYLGLWKTDGTVDGTVQVKDIPVDDAVAFNGLLYFSSNDKLMKTNGTDSGTVMIKQFIGINELTVAGSKLYFSADDGSGKGGELWSSDGISSQIVKDINPGAYGSIPLFLTNVNGVLYFTAETASYGRELWKSNGTAAGTTLVKDIQYGTASSAPVMLTALGSKLIFMPYTPANGREIWVSNGTNAGTYLLKDIRPGADSSGITSFQQAGNYLYFSANDGVNGLELWKTNGNPSGTSLVKDVVPGSESSTSIFSMAALGDYLYFGVREPGVLTNYTGKGNLWKSNGTSTGTVVVSNLNPPGSAFPGYLTDNNGTLYFATKDDSHTSQKLWKTDGAPGGTLALSDIQPYNYSNFVGSPELTVFNGAVYFKKLNLKYDLWKTNGSQAGTAEVKSFTYGVQTMWITSLNNMLLMVANDSIHGTELWRSDGTGNGTLLVKDIEPGITGSDPNGLLRSGNLVYFVATDAVHGSELWRTDGTEAGTFMLKDFNPGTTSSLPRNLTDVNGTLYFRTRNGTNLDLWKTDGTINGTVLVKTLPESDYFTYRFLSNNNQLLFTLEQNGAVQLWKSDGTESGTQKYFTFNNEGYILSYEALSLNGVAYLVLGKYGDEVGKDLWRTDGTAAGTQLVKDLNPNGNDNVTSLTIANGNLVFAALDNTGGQELWKSDGTANGTIKLSNFNVPNPNISEIKLSGNYLYFSANDGIAGQELWKMNVPAPPVGAPDLELKMTASPFYLQQFANVTYTITLTNKGNATANNITVSAPLVDQQLVFTSQNVSKGTYYHWSNLWTVGSLAPGETATLSVTVFAMNTNTATRFVQVQTATPADVDSAPGNDTNQTPNEDDEALLTLGTTYADFEVSAFADKVFAQVGDQVVIRFFLLNKSNFYSGPVDFKCVLPAGVTYVSSYATVGNYDPVSGIWTAYPGSYAEVLNITVTVNQSSPIRVFGQVQAASIVDIDSSPGNNNSNIPAEDDEAVFIINATPPLGNIDLELRQTLAFYSPDTTVIRMVVANKGTAPASNVTVKNGFSPYAGQLNLRSATPTQGFYTPNQHTDLWCVGTIAGGDSAVMLFSLYTPYSATTNFAQVWTAYPNDTDSSPGNDVDNTADEDDESALVVPGKYPDGKPDLKPNSLNVPASGIAGNEISLSVDINNSGQAGAGNSVVRFYLASNPDADLNTATFIGMAEIVPLPVFSYFPLHTSVLIPTTIATGNYYLIVVADADQQVNEQNESNNRVSAPIQISGNGNTQGPDLQLTMVANTLQPGIYNNVTFTVTLSNTGDAIANNVTVAFPLPAGMVYSSHTVSKGSYNLYYTRWDVGIMAPGSSATLTLTLFTLSNTPKVAFAQVQTQSPADADSAPGNNSGNIPSEDDEAAVTINAGNFANGPAGLADLSTQQHPVQIHNIFPVPTDSWVTIQLTSIVEGPVDFAWYDAKGMKAFTHKVMLTKGWNEISFDISALPAGQYHLLVAGMMLKGNGSSILKIK